jgi:hypothetical protein
MKASSMPTISNPPVLTRLQDKLKKVMEQNFSPGEIGLIRIEYHKEYMTEIFENISLDF